VRKYIKLVGRKAQTHDAKFGGKDWRKAQISSIGRKLLYEIHSRLLFGKTFNELSICFL
jgi:hypothetical protein